MEKGARDERLRAGLRDSGRDVRDRDVHTARLSPSLARPLDCARAAAPPGSRNAASGHRRPASPLAAPADRAVPSRRAREALSRAPPAQPGNAPRRRGGTPPDRRRPARGKGLRRPPDDRHGRRDRGDRRARAREGGAAGGRAGLRLGVALRHGDEPRAAPGGVPRARRRAASRAGHVPAPLPPRPPRGSPPRRRGGGRSGPARGGLDGDAGVRGSPHRARLAARRLRDVGLLGGPPGRRTRRHPPPRIRRGAGRGRPHGVAAGHRGGPLRRGGAPPEVESRCGRALSPPAARGRTVAPREAPLRRGRGIGAFRSPPGSHSSCTASDVPSRATTGRASPTPSSTAPGASSSGRIAG